MMSIARAFLLASALPCLNSVYGQTISRDGELLDANKSTVAPAGEFVQKADGTEQFQLTDSVLANLTELGLSDIALFQFQGAEDENQPSQDCKLLPGDEGWPSERLWEVFNLMNGEPLIETVPIGAVCYENNEHYDAVKCDELLSHWTESETHARDPTSVMSPLFQGETCQPQNGNSSTCELGGFPSYSVNATTISQIQIAVNFARAVNLRLVVHNTGHDFLGKSTGAGALSIWTHNLKDIAFIDNYTSPSYQGPALKLGAGVQVGEMYEAADKYGVTTLGGECKDVGVTGGYIAGGGHSPLTTKYGLASDQVLSIDLVTPDGRAVTADENQNKDLFWAIRGGGGATFGVVTSMTVKGHPKMPFSGVTWVVKAGNDTENSIDVFWSAMEAYWRKFPEYAAQGTYGYSSIFQSGLPGPAGAGYEWTMLPWLVPGMELPEFKAMVEPLFKEWTDMGFNFEPEYFEADNFYDTWTTIFPESVVATPNVRTASRLFPKKNWEDEETLNKTMSTIRGIIEEGSAFIQYNINGAAPPGTPDSAANPAWREAVMFGIIGGVWAPNATKEELEEVNEKITNDWMERLREITPGSGGYGNEGDVMEPDFAQAFYGSNYDRLLEIKEATDPRGVFWAPTAVGSESWYVTCQEDWLTLQTGRLCRQ